MPDERDAEPPEEIHIDALRRLHRIESQAGIRPAVSDTLSVEDAARRLSRLQAMADIRRRGGA